MKIKRISMAKENPMKKPFYTQPWFIAVAIIAVLAIWAVATYNGLVGREQSVVAQWAQVETQYQRRYDLIPNLVNTVRQYEQFEAGLLTNLTSLRSQWSAAKTVDEKVAVGSATDSAISRLLLVYENYPELKSITAVSNLMDELAGTENRVSVERMRYNTAVQGFNTAIKTFPTNLLANAFGFTQKAYFTSVSGAETAPVVFP
jgi:LemA protein